MAAIQNLTPVLATAMAVNRAAGDLRDEFASIGVERPVPFIVWKHRLDEEQKSRVQQLLSGNGKREDVELIPLVQDTLKDMQRGKLARIKAAA